jgi:hypothetical protein
MDASRQAGTRDGRQAELTCETDHVSCGVSSDLDQRISARVAVCSFDQ